MNRNMLKNYMENPEVTSMKVNNNVTIYIGYKMHRYEQERTNNFSI